MVGTVTCMSIVDFMWLIQIFDGGRNKLFEGTLGFYSWHSVSASLPPDHTTHVSCMVLVGYSTKNVI